MTQRMRQRLTAEFVILAVMIAVVCGWYIPDVLAKRLSAAEFFDRLVDVRAELVRNYVDEPDEQTMMLGAIQGMLDTLADPYTNYFTAEQLKSFETHTRGTFSGIGAEIDQEGRFIVIVSPLEDSPAFKAGLLAGDLILKVDGESIEGLSTQEAVNKITGPQGTDVVLTIRRIDKEFDVTITRDRIKIQTVKGVNRDETGHWDYMLDEDDGVGYIRLTQFSQPTYENLVAALNELKDYNFKGLILDLRYDPGGLLETAVEVADLFLKDGVIVSTRGRNSPERVMKASADGTLDDFPMVVLINEGSASASEILAGALKYNDRAIILGTRSVGKGSVQQIIPLDGGAGGIKLTTALYYMPNGQNIHRREGAKQWGVDPSDGFYVAMTAEEREKMNDIRRESTVAKPHNGDKARVTPEWIETELADKQLAAALRAILGKLQTGEWAAVGPADATIQVHLSEKALLEAQKKRYLDRVSEIDKELVRIEQILAGAEVPDADAEADAAEHADAHDDAGHADDAVEDDLLETVPAE